MTLLNGNDDFVVNNEYISQQPITALRPKMVYDQWANAFFLSMINWKTEYPFHYSFRHGLIPLIILNFRYSWHPTSTTYLYSFHLRAYSAPSKPLLGKYPFLHKTWYRHPTLLHGHKDFFRGKDLLRLREVAILHRLLPPAREANMPPKHRTAKKVNASFMHLKKTGKYSAVI